MSTINVIGLGYIGLPTALMFANHGHHVQGVDVRADVVENLAGGKIHFHEAGIQTLLDNALANGKFEAGTSIRPADVHILCVPTPIQKNHQPDLSYVEAAAKSLLPVLRKGDLVILESTVPPGTTRDLLSPILADADVLVAHCPETIIPGNMISELVHNDRVIGGMSPAATERAMALYQSFVEGKIEGTDATTAEFVKVAQNTYRDVNIALANELASVCRHLGTDAREMIRIANHHPRVNVHQPGPGVGGHCIPIDPWFLVGLGVETPFICTARAVNDERPRHLANAVAARLKTIDNPVVAVLGVAYKPGVDDARESPAIHFIHELTRLRPEIMIRCTDPYVKNWSLPILSLNDAVHDADIAVTLCEHTEYQNFSRKGLPVIDPVRESE